MNNILIIGSEGFIGSNLVNYYIGKGLRVSGVDHFDNPSQDYIYYKLLSVSDFTQLFLQNKFSHIVNTAGSGNVGFSVNHPLGDFESNCFETIKILDAVRIAGSDINYLHISSAAVYGNPKRLPINENDEIKPLSPYGWHKFISEILCREYSEQFGVKLSILRPFSVYGPGLRKQLFWDIYQKINGRSKLELFGTGLESRDFIYIGDLVNAIDIVLNSSNSGIECYNIASGIETQIQNAAHLFLEQFSSEISLSFTGEKKVEIL